MIATISHPPEQTEFSEELTKYFTTLLGTTRTTHLAQALSKPGEFLYLRTNTLRTTNNELITELKKEDIDAQITNAPLNAVAIPIHSAGPVSRYSKLVVADKASSENLLLGSHLYRPGVIRADRFQKGENVTVVNPRGHIVGSGIAATDSAALPHTTHGLVVKITESHFALPSLSDLKAYQNGLFYSQSLSAMLVAPILAPQPGETIIDFCAAPGGKTTHIAQLVQNDCHLIAVDRSKRRLKRLASETKRLGITCITPFAGRANTFVEQHPTIQADRILVDPPCTVLGVRPKLYDETTLDSIRSTAAYQRMILESAITTLRPRGVLVYSTCTLTVEENEHNIQFLLDTHGFTLEPQTPYIGTGGLVGPAQLQKLVQRIYPDVHDLPGYFIAKLRKPL
ncbi:MAG: PUA domain-containing protein [Candidatus Thorarchaeota archaeon]